MAAQTNSPTFKLVLVGDGGTGKVSREKNLLLSLVVVVVSSMWGHRLACDKACLPILPLSQQPADIQTRRVDHLCQASLDRRIREEVHGHSRCRGSPSGLHHGKPGPDPTLHPITKSRSLLTPAKELRSDHLRCLGHRRPGEVRWSPRRLLHQRTVRYHHVRCHFPHHLQERPQLAP